MGVGPRRCPLRHPLDVPEASTWNVGPAASFFHVTKRGPRKKPPGGERGGGSWRATTRCHQRLGSEFWRARTRDRTAHVTRDIRPGADGNWSRSTTAVNWSGVEGKGRI